MSTSKKLRAGYQRALDRPELRVKSVPREFAPGAATFPLKRRDPEVERMVEQFNKKKGTGSVPAS